MSLLISSLRYQRWAPTGLPAETKGGAFIYDGSASTFHEFEFRTMMRFQTAKPEDRPAVAAKIVEGLRGDAFAIARDVGMTELLSENGVKTLIERIRQQVFPLKQTEAREVFLMGQKPGGPLSRAAGESMASYVVRRKRWWSMPRELDDTIQLSANIRGDLLLDQAGLSRHEKLLVLTSTANDHDFDKIAAALLEQHPKIGYEEDRKGKHGEGKGKHKGKSARGKSHAYVVQDWEGGEEEWYEEEPWYQEATEEGETKTWQEKDLSEQYGDPIEDVELSVYGASIEEDWPEDSLSEVAQAEVLALLAWQRNAKGKKGQGKQRKGKGLYAGGKDWSGKRNLSLEERKRKLAELKSRTRCQACGQQGHWAGDRQCPRSKGSGGGKEVHRWQRQQ